MNMASGVTLGRVPIFPDVLTRRNSAPYSDLKSSALSFFTSRRNSDANKGWETSGCKRCGSLSKNTGSPKQTSSPSTTRNIYRQPSSLCRSRGNGTAATNAWEAKRKHFVQKLMWYSEADSIYERDWSSQPRELSSRRSSVCDNNNALATTDIAVEGSNRRHGILKKTASQDSCVSLYDDNLGFLRGQPASKKAHFKEDVDVIHYDQLETTVSKTGRSLQKLKDEKYLYTVVGENGGGQTRNETVSNACTNSPSKSRQSCTSGSDQSSSEANSQQEPEVPNRMVNKNEMEVITNESGQRKLKFYVRVGTDCIRNRTSVKALSGGKRMLIMAYRYELDENGARLLHQYVERVTLPNVIDPYHVKAFMDIEGNLTIEATIVSSQELGRSS